MIKCLIIDDEPLAVQLLADYVQTDDELELVNTFTNPIKALHFLEDHPVDLLFLDVEMPELTGIQLMTIANGKYQVILTTAYENYAIKGFEFNVIDYLVKPISLERFLIAVQRAKQRLTPKEGNTAMEHTAKQRMEYIFVKNGFKIQRVNLEDILYLESSNDYVSIHTQQEHILTLDTIRHFEELLPPDQFTRVHRSYIVALNKINYIENNRIAIGKQLIPVSKTYQKDFLKMIGND
ncbi:MAG: LytTR family DNA-binding domain-containing protein [Saprospiraceae bacterium]|nr:response regulator transcription factor [Lewinella sp.]